MRAFRSIHACRYFPARAICARANRRAAKTADRHCRRIHTQEDKQMVISLRVGHHPARRGQRMACVSKLFFFSAVMVSLYAARARGDTLTITSAPSGATVE